MGEQAGCGIQKLALEQDEAGDMQTVKSTTKQRVIPLWRQHRATKDDAEARALYTIQAPTSSNRCFRARISCCMASMRASSNSMRSSGAAVLDGAIDDNIDDGADGAAST